MSLTNQRRCAVHISRRNILLASIALILSAPFQLPSRADTFWQADPATPADWFTPGNWSAGVPTSFVSATITNGGTAQIASGSAQSSSLYLGFGAGESGSLALDGGTLAGGSDYVGFSGTGAFTQSNGTNTVSAAFLIGRATGYPLRRTPHHHPL